MTAGALYYIVYGRYSSQPTGELRIESLSAGYSVHVCAPPLPCLRPYRSLTAEFLCLQALACCL